LPVDLLVLVLTVVFNVPESTVARLLFDSAMVAPQSFGFQNVPFGGVYLRGFWPKLAVPAGVEVEPHIYGYIAPDIAKDAKYFSALLT
jgi:hypothetical protein